MKTDPHQSGLLANRYKLIDVVGKGAMGKVYRAQDTLLGNVTVAVKFLSHMLLNQKMRDRFETEATISALLGEKSIHIVRVRDYGVDQDEIPFYVMEFLQGENISDIIKHKPLSVTRFLKLIRQICVGMEAAHQGIIFKGELCSIVHRDIKPSNILVIEDPTLGELIKILDFGIAKLVQSNEAQTQSFMGTLAYCSPEQMEGKELDNRSDIYSLGIMMYEMLTSEMPIMPENPSFGSWYQAHHFNQPTPFNPRFNVPSDIQHLVFQCLAKLPGDRPQNMGDLLKILDKLEPGSVKHSRAISQQTTGVHTLERSQMAQVSVESLEISHHQVPNIILPPQQVLKQKVKLEQLTPDELCWRSSWPKNKPCQKIVFPTILKASHESFVSLWVMLDQLDIVNRVSSTRYNQFLFLNVPHPMILWITVLYNHQYGARWLPCYLDLKSNVGQQVCQVLSQTGYYRILFFAIENPSQCQNMMTSKIAPNQCQMLNDWVIQSRAVKGSEPKASKNILKQEFEKLKSRILIKLETSHSQPSA
jgi:serine/threonine-protein kinase